jgi:hypothetical protein
MSYTKEQLAYIKFNKKKHTKLLACAGSGKTRCIIARMERLIRKKIYEPHEILMLTFSRFTRDDFIRKIIESSGSAEKVIIPESSIKTIDSFAKNIIDKDDIIDVSLLSSKLADYLEAESSTELMKDEYLNSIKMVFIDEAQDINEIQYRIFLQLIKKLGVLVNMVGDPNQNIFQFRQSSDKFLLEFDAVTHSLTKNFRSYKPIVEFSKYLRPFQDNDIECHKGNIDCKPVMMFYDDEDVLEDGILMILKQAMRAKIDLSEFAILAPTRGRMRTGGKSHGLCFVSNILHKAGIKFKQFYEESTDNASVEGIKYEPKKGHVNMLTYMGSKGLEWNYVILIDADTCLINKCEFNKTKHKNDRYLLYVACSRAITNMYIFSKCSTNGEPYFNTNPWFKKVPHDLYIIEEDFEEMFKWPRLRYKSTNNRDIIVNKLVEKLDHIDLNELSNKVMYGINKPKVVSLYKRDYSSKNKYSSSLLRRYIKLYYYALVAIKNNGEKLRLPDIETLINDKGVVSDVSESFIRWYYENKNSMDWDIYDESVSNKEIDEYIVYTVEKKFDRSRPFNSHSISINGYYDWYITSQNVWMKQIYNDYLKSKDPKELRELVFYLALIQHAFVTQHYYHIKTKGASYSQMIEEFKGLFKDIARYVRKAESYEFSKVDVNCDIKRWGLLHHADMVINGVPTIITLDNSLKVVSKILIASIMVSDITEDFNIKQEMDLNMSEYSESDDEFNEANNEFSKMYSDQNTKEFKFNVINFITGELHQYKLELSGYDVREIIELLQKNITNQPDIVEEVKI